ncbi:MAG TPA: DUF1501 domain-containing protein [Pirellulales bacterium]|nr:DUF1501 domain-containing protein [Pirellulales bacterium]
MLWLNGSSADLRRGWSRRDCLRAGLIGALGGGLVTPAASHAATDQDRPAGFGQADACIFIYLFGGPSHIDIWDMKPDAPEGIRGEFKPVATNVPGVQITEHLPRLSRHADKYAVLRSLTHGDNSHGSAGHIMMTGHRPRLPGEIPPSIDDFPHFGSVLGRVGSGRHSPLPYVSLPQVLETSTNVVPGQNGGFLGRAVDPFRLARPDDGRLLFDVPLVRLPDGVDERRLHERAALLGQLEAYCRTADSSECRDHSAIFDRAMRFLAAPATAGAFQLDREPAALRQRYGMNVFGQSLLLARRLVEAGVRTIMVGWPDRTEPEAFINNGKLDGKPVALWDTHGSKVGNTPNFPVLRDQALPVLDRASSALLEDLSDRGLLRRTLIVWTGEFGRSPRVNSMAGRDHYGNVFSAMLAGGGIRGGQVYGSSDRIGAWPQDNPVLPGDFSATLYHALGLKADTMLADRLGRPLRLCEGQPLRALF